MIYLIVIILAIIQFLLLSVMESIEFAITLLGLEIFAFVFVVGCIVVNHWLYMKRFK